MQLFLLFSLFVPSLPTIVQLDRDYQAYCDGNDDEFSMSEIKDSFLFFYMTPPIVFIFDINVQS